MPLELHKRGKIWHVRGTVRGQNIRETTGTSDWDKAELYRATREARLYEASIFGERAIVSYRRAALSYIEDGKEPRSNATLAFVRRLTDHFGDKMLAEIAGDNAQSLLDAAVRTIVGEHAAPATKNRAVITPHNAILRHASRRGWCQRPDFERPSQPDGKTRWLTPREALSLIDAASPHLKPLLIFLLCTGSRLSEALELEWRDVDLPTAKVVFRDTKNGSERPARLPPAAILALANIPADEDGMRRGNVFRRDDGEPYADRERQEGGQIKTAFKTALRRAGIRAHTTPHDLRHSWATWFYGITKDALLLKDEGGWKVGRMIERYTHLMRSDLVPEIRLVWGDSHPRIGFLPGTPPANATRTSLC